MSSPCILLCCTSASYALHFDDIDRQLTCKAANALKSCRTGSKDLAKSESGTWSLDEVGSESVDEPGPRSLEEVGSENVDESGPRVWTRSALRVWASLDLGVWRR